MPVTLRLGAKRRASRRVIGPDHRFAILCRQEVSMPKPANRRPERVTMHMTPAQKRTLQEAAAVTNKSLTAFVLHSAMTAAEEFLPDRRKFYLDHESWDAFMAALEAPPKDNPQLRKLFARTRKPADRSK
jgi:uncharacterized protein (DUF1778 family)